MRRYEGVVNQTTKWEGMRNRSGLSVELSGDCREDFMKWDMKRN